MIGGINKELDIEVFLDAEEVKKLQDEVLEGILIKWNKPKQQGTVQLSIEDGRSTERGFGIGVVDTGYGWDSVGKFELFMSKQYYAVLREQGVVSIRYGIGFGSKVEVYNKSKLEDSDELRVQNLEHYRDNKDKLPDCFS